MKKLLASAAFVAMAFAATGALADNPYSRQIDVTAEVDNSVYLSGTEDTSDVVISNFAGSDGKADAGTADRTVATELTATGQVEVGVSSGTGGYLSLNGATDCLAASATCVPYAATATFNAPTAIDATADASTPDVVSTSTTTGAGSLTLHLVWSDGNDVLNTGDFQDTLTVRVGTDL